jgi:hypothetical protein
MDRRERDVRRWRLLGRDNRATSIPAVTRGCPRGQDRRGRGLQGRPFDAVVVGLCQNRRHLRQRECLFRVGCPVRAGGNGRAHPRQDRRLEAQGHVDGRSAVARLRCQRQAARCQRGRSRNGPIYLSSLYRTQVGSPAEGRPRCARHRQQDPERSRWNAVRSR